MWQVNKSVQALLNKEYAIEHLTTICYTKASIVERFNRTLKSRIWRFFTASKTKRFLDVLEDIVDSYNNAYHRSIRMKPSQVRRKDETVVWRRLYGDGARNLKRIDPLKSGDTVRIPKWKGDFAKGYEPNWTEEEFKMHDVVEAQQPKKVYKIEDTAGESIVGDFYPQQLQKIVPSEDYILERVVKRRVNRKTKQKEVLVKW